MCRTLSSTDHGAVPRAVSHRPLALVMTFTPRPPTNTQHPIPGLQGILEVVVALDRGLVVIATCADW